MRFNEFKSVETKVLGESKGFFGRDEGDVFTHQDGREYKIVQVVAFPDAQTQRFETPQARDEAIKAFQEEHGDAEIEWVNNPRSNMLAFGIAQLDDQDGNHVFWGKYMQSVSFDMMGAWANKQTPPGWALQTKGAQKFASGYDPQHLIKTENRFKGTDSIINTVVQNADDQVKEVFKEALQNLAQGRGNVVFPAMYEQQAALRDYFGEVMQPVALMGGVIKGQAEDARRLLADGAEWRDCEVMWPMAMNAALCDSFMIAPNGAEIGVSSKGGQGAAASAKNLNDAVLKAEKNGNDIVNEGGVAKFAADLVKIIAAETAINGPVKVAQFLGIDGIDESIQEEIDTYIKEGKSDLEGMSPKAQKIAEPFAFKLETKGFNTGYALLSAVSKTCAKVVNAQDEFSKGAIALLNQSDIIQLYTKMGKKGDDAVLGEFKAVYPPTFSGKVLLEGGKNYYSSRVGGKMAFAIGKK
jgi:hypothetical protein